MFYPNFNTEKKLLFKYSSIAGCDEVGAGPLAGPVVAASVILPIKTIENKKLKNTWWEEVKDSKLLTQKKREELAPLIYEHALSCGIGLATVKEIDTLNILQARLLAIKRAVENLKITPDFLLIDGNAFIHEKKIEQKTIIQGDKKVLSIACASILAKVCRDNLLNKIHEQHPNYGFNQHKGYPTRLHYERLKKFGPCEEHRLTFSPVKLLINNKLKRN